MSRWVFLLVCTGLCVAQVPQSRHVWIVAEENHSYEDVIGNASMPYFNSLAKKYGLATQYYSVQHNSLSALMWVVAGNEITTNDDTTACYKVNNVVRRVLKEGATWKAYEEDMPYAGFQELSYLNYVRRHNPLIDFTDSCADGQVDNSVPFTQLAADIESHSTPNYAYITPNLQHDAHDGTLAQADQWLSQQLPAILALPEFQPGGDGLMFIMWDEGDLNGNQDDRCAKNIPSGCGGRLATLVIGPQVRPGVQSTILYSHPNLLATVCEAMEFSSCPGAGRLAGGMTDFFNSVNVSNPFPGAAVASPVHIQATTDNDSPVTTMQVYVDNLKQYQSTGGTLDAYVPMSVGAHYVVVQSWDTAGGIHKRGLYVTVQSEAVVVTSPAPGAVVSSPVAIDATAGGQYNVNLMQVFVDGSLQYQANGATVNTNLSMAAGEHQVAVKAQDISGETTTNSFPVTVATPAVTINTPSANAQVYSPVPLLGTSIDPSQVYAVQAYVDNVLHYQYTGTGIKASLPMTVGQHSLVVQAWDVAGGIHKAGENLTVIPIPVTISSPAPNANVASPVLVEGSVPHDSPVDVMQVYVDNVLKYKTSGKKVKTKLAMSPGAHYIVVQAWDTGNGTWKSGVNITVH